MVHTSKNKVGLPVCTLDVDDYCCLISLISVTDYDKARDVHPVHDVQNEDQTRTPTCLAV